MATSRGPKKLFQADPLARLRIAIAVVAALSADVLQVSLQAVPLAPQAIDVVVSVVVMMAIGFHILLLPSFVLELIPLVDDLPFWTVCVLSVIALRRHQEKNQLASIPLDSKDL